MAEPEPRGGQRRTGVHRALQKLRAGVEVIAVLEHARERLPDQARARQRLLVARGALAGDVERLRAVGQGVKRGTATLCPRQLERQLRLVNDSCEVRAAAAADHVPLWIADAEELRPLRARVGRGDRDERQAGD